MLKKAVIVGASGLIGTELLDILLQSTEYQEVLILIRKEMPINHSKLVQLVINFDELDKWTNAINGHAIFSCLGTTNAQTPDKQQYRKIDHDYPVKLAQIALKNGIKQFHLISAIGANIKASGFYLRLKGQTEHDVEQVGIKTLHIYQPSLLTGRTQKTRAMEQVFSLLMKAINPLLIGGLKKYRSIPAATVARAMYNQSLKNDVGVYIHTTDKIKQLA
jgi:uncharacterized protein YbjT (DUF2867 family)